MTEGGPAVSLSSPLVEMFTHYQKLLISEDPANKVEFDKEIEENSQELLKLMFSTNVLNEPWISASQEFQTVFCIVTSELCKTVAVEQLAVLNNCFSYLLASPKKVEELYSSIIQAYGRALSLKEKDFPVPPPINEIFLMVEGDSESSDILLEVLATCAIFNSVKVQIVALQILQRLSPRLAASEDAHFVCAGLGLLHSVCFNLSDDCEDSKLQQSVFDVVAPAVGEVQLVQLVSAVLEKALGPEVSFNVMMVLHGCLLPQTRELACLQNAQFVARQLGVRDETSIQVVCETLIKLLAVGSQPCRREIAGFVLDDQELVKALFAVLEVSQNFSSCALIVSLLQIASAAAPPGPFTQYAFSTIALFHYAARAAQRLSNQPLEMLVDQLEACYKTALYLTESRAVKSWGQIAVSNEGKQLLYLAMSLGAVSGLLKELPGICGVLGIFCGLKCYLIQFEKQEDFGEILAFLLDMCVLIERGAEIIVCSVLKGISQFKEAIKGLDAQKFILLVNCFKIELSEEYDDVLTDIVEAYGNQCPAELIAEIQNMLTDIENDKGEK